VTWSHGFVNNTNGSLFVNGQMGDLAMISEEDMAFTQSRLIELSDENLDLRSALQAAQEDSRQIPVIRARLTSLHKSNASDARAYEKEAESLRSQKAKVTRRSGDRDPLPLQSAEQKLADESDRLTALIETESELTGAITEAAVEIGQWQAVNNSLRKRIAHCEVLQPQLCACCGLGVHVQDLSACLDQIRGQRALQKGREKRLANWFTQTATVYEHQETVVEGLCQEFGTIAGRLEIRETELLEIEDVCNGVKGELSILTEAIQSEERICKELRATMETERETFGIEATKQREKLEMIEREIRNADHGISTHSVSAKKLMNKKVDMAQQLERRLSSERENLRANTVEAGIIEELTETLSIVMIEKQKLIDALKKGNNRLRWLQTESQKKSLMISELQVKIIPKSSETRTMEEALDDFQHLLDDTNIQNTCHFDNLQIAGLDVEGLESERVSLLAMLSQLEQSS
jgi:chromosome segregation ATPase